jgi:protein FAM32A
VHFFFEFRKKKNTEQATASVASAPVVSPSSLQANVDGMTKAERAFEAAQRKRESEMIEKKTAKSHRQKIEEFNAYLAKLPEHHDIPRVCILILLIYIEFFQYLEYIVWCRSVPANISLFVCCCV